MDKYRGLLSFYRQQLCYIFYKYAVSGQVVICPGFYPSMFYFVYFIL